MAGDGERRSRNMSSCGSTGVSEPMTAGVGSRSSSASREASKPGFSKKTRSTEAKPTRPLAARTRPTRFPTSRSTSQLPRVCGYQEAARTKGCAITASEEPRTEVAPSGSICTCTLVCERRPSGTAWITAPTREASAIQAAKSGYAWRLQRTARFGTCRCSSARTASASAPTTAGSSSASWRTRSLAPLLAAAAARRALPTSATFARSR
mmetsp:Transcript_48945/g.140185  ORF Transcript_48945/g.140185 Transcript_48945/m.140185 type:complete len:209 (+) Transcript_48945:379-1005(+)